MFSTNVCSNKRTLLLTGRNGKGEETAARYQRQPALGALGELRRAVGVAVSSLTTESI